MLNDLFFDDIYFVCARVYVRVYACDCVCVCVSIWVWFLFSYPVDWETAVTLVSLLQMQN